MQERLPKAIEMLLKCKLLQMIKFQESCSYDEWSSEGCPVPNGPIHHPQDQTITAQANREVVPREKQHASTIASCLRDFTRINPPKYFGSKVDEDPQDFLDEVYNILFSMGMSSMEKIELAAYKLKDVAQTWYNQSKDSRALGGGLLTWEIFKKAFLDRFFQRK